MHDRWVSLAAVWFSLVAMSAWAASGRPDPAFGAGGIVIAPVLEYSDALALVRQPDGALVAGGAAGQTGFPYLRDMLLARFAADGSPDATFGTDGVVLTPIAGRRSVARRVLLQPDGKLIAVGSLDEDYSSADVALARFDATGALDPSFGSGGIVILDDLGGDDRVWDAALQLDGSIVVAGTTGGVGGQDGMVLRFDSTGALDPSFGTGGVVLLDQGGRFDEIQDVLLVPGRILVGGWAADPLLPYTGVRSAVVVALLGDGSVDPTFGVGGVTEVSVDYRTNVRTMVGLSDGDIYVVGGASGDGISGYSLVMRLNADGTPDAGFGGGDGIISPSTGGLVTSLLAMPDDRIFGAGPGFLWGHWGSIGLGRYLSNGSPDPTFGNAGVASLYPGVGDYYNAAAQALVVEPDGSAVTVAGFFSPVPYEPSSPQGRQLTLARFLVDDEACTFDAHCAVCERCGTTGVCERGPRTGCLRPSPYRGAKILYAGGPVRPKIIWKWRSGPALTSFNPTTSDDVGLCMWWGTTPLYESTIPAGTGWVASGTGFKYRDRAGSAFGIQQVKINKSALQVKAVGEAIKENPNGFPDALLAPGDDSVALEVQLHSSNGACFATTYPQSVLEGKYPQHTRSGLGY